MPPPSRPPGRSPAPPRRRAAAAVSALLFAAFAVRPALAEPVIVASAQGGPAELSRADAEALFLGHGVTLADGRRVALVDLPDGALRDEFYLRLTGKNPVQIRAWWSRQVFTGRARPPREAASVAEARQWIAGSPNAIGYLDRADVSGGLRILLRLP